ncbi:hypothetical protein BKA67DRAFT_580631 [Truncatella angustata]|uniref:Uncharacterized protein n=1 Tax=Truncatella angustata TaxID=152316 RepID=A0A9P8UCK4_9PEZI|nr:uncharacterized protein BKA67DRAFT_580631 [Truncatella angustata]KAH6646806.1 hypothetical protein BKA67DRAFT_580631 [Truncatella angustata]
MELSSQNGHTIMSNKLASTHLLRKPFSVRNLTLASNPAHSIRNSCISRGHVSRLFGSGFALFRSRRPEMNKGPTVRGERKFFGLIQPMNDISGKNTSWKVVWTRVMPERGSCIPEMDKMQDRIDEYTELIERKDKNEIQPGRLVWRSC